MENRPVQIVARQSRMRTGARHEKQGVQRVVDHDAMLGAMMRRLAGHRKAVGLRWRASRGRQGLDVAAEDARVGFEFLDGNFPSDESVEVLRVKGRQLRQRTRGDMPVLVVSARIGLVRGTEARQRVAIGRGKRHRANGTVLDQVQDSAIKMLVGVVGHAARAKHKAGRTQRGTRAESRPQFSLCLRPAVVHTPGCA